MDVEPNRSVQIIRRIDTRTPSPLLSQVLSQSALPSVVAGTSNSWGRLTDLRNPSTARSNGLQPLGNGGPPLPNKVPTGKGWAAQRSSPVPVWRTQPTAPSSEAKPVAISASANVAGPSTSTMPPAQPGDFPVSWEDED